MEFIPHRIRNAAKQHNIYILDYKDFVMFQTHNPVQNNNETTMIQFYGLLSSKNQVFSCIVPPGVEDAIYDVPWFRIPNWNMLSPKCQEELFYHLRKQNKIWK